MTTPGARLRAAWSAGPIMIPGAFNALVAKLAERLGFKAVYLSGGALSAGWAGLAGYRPVDPIGVRRASGCPRAGDGVAGPLRRRYRLRRGDQRRAHRPALRRGGRRRAASGRPALPKRCGHLSGKALVDRVDDGEQDPGGG